jgi:1,4-dihydroxy-2-naphthoyl-CoA hydrolase
VPSRKKQGDRPYLPYYDLLPLSSTAIHIACFMPFIYSRTVRFQDTDAAGVVYFANVLSFCHEAYEASLAKSGVNLNAFFCYPKIAIPITHVTTDFLRPMFCGDELKIYVSPKQLKADEFEIEYEVFSIETVVEEITNVQEVCTARAFTKHVCIDAVNRVRINLPNHVTNWLNQWGTSLNDPIELM